METYETDTCPGCNAILVIDETQRGLEKSGWSRWYICPECHKEGCYVCMPCGRGCKCLECEETSGRVF